MTDLVYSPPGVSIAETASPVPNVSGLVAIPPARICLIGPSIGYQTDTAPVVLSGTTPVTLPNKGVILASVVVSTLTGTVSTITTDYVLAQSGSPVEESLTTVARVNGGGITDGQTVYVTYNFTNSDYYLPFLSSDWDQIQTRFGAAINGTTGVIGSPLALAAKVVLEQGTREVVLVPTKGSTPSSVTAAQINSAYANIEARDDLGIVVPLGIGITGTDVSPGDTTNLVQNLKTHVETQATQGHYRMGIVGLDTGAVRTSSTLAASIASQRVVFAFPNIVSFYNGYTNTTIDIGGCYLAAAYAGMLGARNSQEPLTRKPVRSFSAIPARVLTTMTVASKNDMSNMGVAVTEQTGDGSLVVRHGVTTDRSSVLTREISIIRAKDTMISLVYQSLTQAAIIGTPLTDETPVRIQSIVDGALTQAKNAGIFIDYSNLAVAVDPNDSTAVRVKFAYKPAYPLNYVTVSFSINTVTGNVAQS